MGGDLDGYNSYAQRGNLPTLQHVLTEGIAMMPFLSKLKMLRTWGGIMDMSMDGSPIIDKTHIEGLYLNCGWCYGGFKACLLYTSPSPRDKRQSRMPSSA